MSALGIVTVTYNSASVLPEFLESIWKQTHVEYLLYIVDSGSTDATREFISAASDCRLQVVLLDENVGFAAASNIGVGMALEDGCDSVMLMNNDTAFGPDLFRGLLSGLDQHNSHMTTPKMLYYGDTNKIWAAGGRLNRWIGYRQRHDGLDKIDDDRFDLPRRVTFTPFCCVLMRSSVFERIGFLDENYFVYVEDVDYCYRALKAGLSIWYLPHCRLWHKVSSLTGGTASEFSVRHGTRNRVYYMFKNLPILSAVFWTTAYGVSHLLRYIVGREPRALFDLRLASLREGAKLGFSAGRSVRS